MKIMPMLSRGEVFVHEDGSLEVAPMQVFRSLGGGGTVLRIGRNTYHFDEDGAYDGSEHHLGVREGTTDPVAPSADPDAVVAALHASVDNRNRAPSWAYYEEGSKGWRAETAAWPKVRRKEMV